MLGIRTRLARHDAGTGGRSYLPFRRLSQAVVGCYGRLRALRSGGACVRRRRLAVRDCAFWSGESVAIALGDRRGQARLRARLGAELRADWTRRSVRNHHPSPDRWEEKTDGIPILMLLQYQPPQQTVSSLKSLHLLRALLREASYLPDANARSYFRRYIVNRFRAYQPQENASSSLLAKAVEKKRHRFGKRRPAPIIEERTQAMQRKAKKGLNYLRLANTGDFRCLTRILYLTYGRIGKRKHALLHQLQRPDDPTALQEPSPLQKLYYGNNRFLSFFDPPVRTKNTHWSIHISDHYARFRTALKAQHNKGIALGRELKLPYLLTPINNVWERPMPIRRARNNVRRWYIETMTRFLPPLPADEFDAIQAMADGAKRPSLVQRRAPAVQFDPPPEPSEFEKFRKIVHDAITLEKPPRADRRPPTSVPTARRMKRLYKMILPYCSKLNWNEELGRWESAWGDRWLGQKTLNNVDSAALFAGVDTTGKVVRERSECTHDPADDAHSRKNRPKSHQHSSIPLYAEHLPADHPISKAAKAAKAAEEVGNQSASGALPLRTGRSQRTAPKQRHRA